MQQWLSDAKINSRKHRVEVLGKCP